MENQETNIIPRKEQDRIRGKKVRALYRIGYSMNEIVIEMEKLGQGLSKTTVYNILKKGRKKGKTKT